MKHTPISTQERIQSLDVVRGFALLGIFLVNMPTFQWPDLTAQLHVITPELTGADKWIHLFFDLLVQAKFYTIFSFLFGIGFYIFMKRAEEKGLKVYRLISRRLIILAFFGFAHIIFLWYGDILHTYALAGFLLMLFYKRETKTVLIWIAILAVFIVGMQLINLILPADFMEQEIQSLQEAGAAEMEESVSVYQHASYGEWLRYRLKAEVVPILTNIPFAIMTPLFMFLIGLYAARKGIFQHIRTHLRFVRKVWLICLVVSLPISVQIVLLHLGAINTGLISDVILQSYVMISGLFLSLFYIASILLLLQKASWQKLFMPFAYAGRMALTNYILQTIIGVSIFTGLGLYGEVNLTLGLLICLIVFPLQILFSYIWLKKFRFGPLEWVWRTLTYGKMQPMRNADQHPSMTVQG